jgi:hypothetical protein
MVCATRNCPYIRPRRSRVQTIIDLTAVPFIPDGWELEEHHGEGVWQFDSHHIQLWLTPLQSAGNSMEHGEHVIKELGDLPVLNANVLDWLLLPENQHLIPNGWRSKIIYFWGTIYSWNRRRWKVVRCLQYTFTDDGSSKWLAHPTRLSAVWGTNMPAAILQTRV